MVIDAVRQSIDLKPSTIATLSRRDIGVGFDQCLLIEKSLDPDLDFFYRIFNADGQEVGQCGNGARCLARFVLRYGLTHKKSIRVATKTTRMQLQMNADETVTVDMGQPRFAPTQIPLLAETELDRYSLPLKHRQTCEVHAVNVGNPHAVLRVAHLETANIEEIGPQISTHAYFPEQTNAGFMQIVSPQQIKLRVYERGCGETRACGSGAVAAVAIGQRYHQLAERVTVNLLGGDLIVSAHEGSLFLTGPATFVYEGKLEAINDRR